MVLILTDADVARSCTASRAIAVTRRALQAHGEARLSAPPRAYNDIAPGRLVYTAGALEGLVHGVRIYDHADSEQVVAVWDSQSRRLAAVVLGAELGRRRTGAIGAIAVDTLARSDANTLGVIGTGHQAWAQVWAATAVRDWSHIKIYSRNPYSRERFAARCREQLLVDAVAVDNPRTAFRHRDAVIVATNSPTPVFDTAWLEPGMHITSVGPKTLSAHEVPLDLLDRVQLVVTDSIAQVHGNPQPNALSTRNMVELGKVLAGTAAGRGDDDQVTLFCSVGLAGTEVVLAADLAGLTTVLPPRVLVEAPPVSPAMVEAVAAPSGEDVGSPGGTEPQPAIPAQSTSDGKHAGDGSDISQGPEGGDLADILPSQAEPPDAEKSGVSASDERDELSSADDAPEAAASAADSRSADTESEPAALADGQHADAETAPAETADARAEAEATVEADVTAKAQETTAEAAEAKAVAGETADAGAEEADGEEAFPPALAALMKDEDGEPDATDTPGAAAAEHAGGEPAGLDREPADDGKAGDGEAGDGEAEEAHAGDAESSRDDTRLTEADRRTEAEPVSNREAEATGETGADAEATEETGAAAETAEEGQAAASLTADDDRSIEAMKEAAARIVRPQSKKSRPKTRR